MRAPIPVVLDTDAYNEIDDQFAIAWMLREPGLSPEAFYAAPFLNERSRSPSDGMEKSYEEIGHILRLAGREDRMEHVYRGSAAFLTAEDRPQPSPAAEDLIRRSHAYCRENPLMVAAIGALTNIASALLLDPTLADRIALVFLGGHSRDWGDAREFNLNQDVAAGRVVFSSGVPILQIPCFGVADALMTTKPELTAWLSCKNELCDYLTAHTIEAAESYAKGKAWSRVIWDIAAVACLLQDGEKLADIRTVPLRMPKYGGGFEEEELPRTQKIVRRVYRDAVFTRMFHALGGND